LAPFFEQTEILGRGNDRLSVRRGWSLLLAVLDSCLKEADQQGPEDQRTWCRSPTRDRKEIKLSTIQAQLDAMRSLVKNHGMGMDASTVPNFDHVVVPQQETSRRWETLTEEMFEALVQSLLALLLMERWPRCRTSLN
jgi:hypothetical protein